MSTMAERMLGMQILILWITPPTARHRLVLFLVVLPMQQLRLRVIQTIQFAMLSVLLARLVRIACKVILATIIFLLAVVMILWSGLRALMN